MHSCAWRMPSSSQNNNKRDSVDNGLEHTIMPMRYVTIVVQDKFQPFQMFQIIPMWLRANYHLTCHCSRSKCSWPEWFWRTIGLLDLHSTNDGACWRWKRYSAPIGGYSSISRHSQRRLVYGRCIRCVDAAYYVIIVTVQRRCPATRYQIQLHNHRHQICAIVSSTAHIADLRAMQNASVCVAWCNRWTWSCRLQY